MGKLARASEAQRTANRPTPRQLLEDEIVILEERLRREGATRFEAWSQHYLPGQFFAPPGDFHRKLYKDAEDLLWRRPIDGAIRASTAIACPRGHGKSTAMVSGLPTWVALEYANMPIYRDDLKGRAPYIVIVSDTVELATARVMEIRDELEGNEALIARYGYQGPVKGQRGRRKWTQKFIELANGTIIRAVGYGGAVRGMLFHGRRPNLILCDDMENDQAVETDTQRFKLRAWFTKALLPIGMAGEMLTIAVGTILHADSLMARLVSPEHFEGWVKRRYAAQWNNAGLPDPDGDNILWPERWNREALAEMRTTIGTLAYTQEYLNQPIDDESSAFRWAWLEAARLRGTGRRFDYAPPKRIPYDDVISTWDPIDLAQRHGVDALQVLVTAWDIGIIDDADKAREKDSDYTVGLTVGLTVDERFLIRRIYRKRGMSPAEFRERVISEQNVLGSDYVVIEANAAQRIHELDLRQIGLPIVRHITTAAKHSIWTGVPGMGYLFEMGRIDLCHDTIPERDRIATLMQELHGLGREAHDDTVMALWMAIVTIRKWIFKRNARRKDRIGAPPPGVYETPFPQRESNREAA